LLFGHFFTVLELGCFEILKNSFFFDVKGGNPGKRGIGGGWDQVDVVPTTLVDAPQSVSNFHVSCAVRLVGDDAGTALVCSAYTGCLVEDSISH
jgi:hypothetical protein